MKELVRYPPKYQLEDGSIQVWRGMPKLPDVVQVMLELRKKAVMEAHRQEQERYSKEMDELKKYREEHPEEFFTWADVVKAASERSPQVKALAKQLDPRKPDKRTSRIAPILNDVQYKERQLELEEQKKRILNAEDSAKKVT